MRGNEIDMLAAGHGLTTARIFYRLPDFEAIIQSYLWQEYDTAPKFPKLWTFLDFWQKKLDGPIHSVQYTHHHLISAGELNVVDGEFRLN